MSGEDIRAKLHDRLKRLMKTSFCSSLQANSDTNSCVQ
jgi:hypothetical protein